MFTLKNQWQGTWDSAEPLGKKTNPAIKYLKNNGIKKYLGRSEFRYSDGLVYYQEKKRGSYPALLCSYSDDFNNQTGIYRIYLNKEGELANVQEPKLFLGTLTGSSIKFGELTGVLNLSFDVETALAVHQATGQASWACLMVSNLFYGYQNIPIEVSTVNLWLNSGEKHAGQAFINHRQREGLNFFFLHSKNWPTRIKEKGLTAKTAAINSRLMFPSVAKSISENSEF